MSHHHHDHRHHDKTSMSTTTAATTSIINIKVTVGFVWRKGEQAYKKRTHLYDYDFFHLFPSIIISSTAAMVL